MVTFRGELDRAEAGRFLRDAFMELQPQRQHYVWVGWQSAIAMLGMTDLKLLVKKAFDRGFIDSHVLGFDHFEEDLRRGIEHPGEPRLPDDRESTLFGDTVEELSGSYCFTEQYRDDQERWRRQAESNYARSQCLENPFKGIGRNDPRAARRRRLRIRARFLGQVHDQDGRRSLAITGHWSEGTV